MKKPGRDVVSPCWRCEVKKRGRVGTAVDSLGTVGFCWAGGSWEVGVEEVSA